MDETSFLEKNSLKETGRVASAGRNKESSSQVAELESRRPLPKIKGQSN
jgi:hypothetical protein